MITLKDKEQNGSANDEYAPDKYYYAEDVKKAILNYKMYQNIYYWRAKNIGAKDTKEITEKINYLEKYYNCKYYELSFDNIFGDFENG